MKPNVKMIDKSKNSFIFFQIGLIAVMVTVLFVLEFNFKDVIPKETAKVFPVFPDDSVFVYNPKIEEVKVERNTETKVVKQTVQQKFVNNFVKSDIEVKDDVIEEIPHDEPLDNVVDNSIPANPSNNGVTNSPVDVNKVFVVVEELPMFPSCKGVSKEQQKACFDEQLRKAIFRNLKYPERDLEDRKEGTVYVQFIIDQMGNFTAITPVENNRSTADMKKAVESAVKKLPKIIPAKQGGRDVKIQYTMPITFKIAK